MEASTTHRDQQPQSSASSNTPSSEQPNATGSEVRRSVEVSRSSIYVGFADLLPENLVSLYSAAGFFFANEAERDRDQIRVCVASLPHRLNTYDRRSWKRHTGYISLSEEQFAQMLAYDRRVAILETSDLRELLDQHVQEQRNVHTHQPVKALSGTNDTVPANAVVSEESASTDASPNRLEHTELRLDDTIPVREMQSPTVERREKQAHNVKPQPKPQKSARPTPREKRSCVVGSQITVSCETLHTFWERTKEHHLEDNLSKKNHRDLLFLRGALATVTDRHEEQLLRDILLMRDRIRPQVSVTPVYAAGVHPSIVEGNESVQQIVGCKVTVYVPYSLVA